MTGVSRQSNLGSALITTLLVIVVLTIIVTAFLQSMTLERQTSRSYLNQYRARLAALAGLEVALARIEEFSTPNMIVALDKSKPRNERELLLWSLNPSGQPLKAAGDSLGVPEGDRAERMHRFLPDSALEHRAPINRLSVDGRPEIGYSFYVRDNAGEQTIDRYPSLVGSVAGPVRAFATTLREIPLLIEDETPLADADREKLDAFARQRSDLLNNPPNGEWTDFMLTTETANQVIGSSAPIDDNWMDIENWSPSMARTGTRKLDLRRLKFHLDATAASNQGPDNPRAQIVEALLERDSPVDPDTTWGGGTLEWLVNESNEHRYTDQEARQIVANLLDYLDEDLHPTTDNIDNPTYLGVEGRYEPDGTVKGHPYIASLGCGLVFNLSAASGATGGLNSTRVLACWSLVNPWSSSTFPVTGSSSNYQVELTIAVRGEVQGGTLGTDAGKYFGKAIASRPDELNERLNIGPISQIPPYRGYTFPESPSGMSFANFYTLPSRQPAEMAFRNIEFDIIRARLKFRSTDGSVSYVQVLDGIPNIPMNPREFTLPKRSGGSAVYNPQTVNRWIYLVDDPRRNFLPSSWQVAQTSVFSGTTPPRPNPEIDVFSRMEGDGDGAQGVTPTSRWFESSNLARHFFARSPKAISGPNPATSNYDPETAPVNLAVDSIAEMGYLWTGRPWQTLSMVNAADGARPDYELLDFVEPGTIPLRDSPSSPPGMKMTNGKLNVNTATRRALGSLFLNVPGIAQEDIDTLVSAIEEAPPPNYPFIGAVDFASQTALAQSLPSKFAREELIRRIANVTITRTYYFTIHAYGEAYGRNGRVNSTARLKALVQLQFDEAGRASTTIVRKHWE